MVVGVCVGVGGIVGRVKNRQPSIMSKRALLVGCNYPGTKCELHGCANDVRRMKALLLDRFGFDEADILVMLDSDKSLPQPTGKNVRRSLAKLIENTQAGDCLVFHYSGHGTQVWYGAKFRRILYSSLVYYLR